MDGLAGFEMGGGVVTLLLPNSFSLGVAVMMVTIVVLLSSLEGPTLSSLDGRVMRGGAESTSSSGVVTVFVSDSVFTTPDAWCSVSCA